MAPYNERRKTIRIGTEGNLQVETVTPGPKLKLVDVGEGGFCARSSVEMPLDVVTSYRFTTPARKWTAIFRARTAHCRSEIVDGKPTVNFLTGFCFVNVNSQAVQQQLSALLDRAMNFVSFS
jgi:hypothetical protein